MEILFTRKSFGQKSNGSFGLMLALIKRLDVVILIIKRVNCLACSGENSAGLEGCTLRIMNAGCCHPNPKGISCFCSLMDPSGKNLCRQEGGFRRNWEFGIMTTSIWEMT